MGFSVLVFGSVSMEKERDNEKCDYSNKKPQSIRLNQSSGVEGGTRMWLFQNQSSFSLEESFFLSFSVSG